MGKFAMTKVNPETSKKELTRGGKITIGAIIAGIITGVVVVVKKILTDSVDEPTMEETKEEPTDICNFQEEPVREDEISVQENTEE